MSAGAKEKRAALSGAADGTQVTVACENQVATMDAEEIAAAVRAATDRSQPIVAHEN